MSVKILIERKFKEGVGAETLKTINALRIGALKMHGYIGGETLVSHADQRDVLVISQWGSMEDWKAWQASPEREQLEKTLSRSLEGPTRISEFMSGTEALKAVFHKALHDKNAAATS
jgi:heme oxygenase (mycobilin-producing)